MKKVLLIFLTVFITQFTFSQTEELKRDKYKLVTNLDIRNSFVIGHSVTFYGGKIGVGNSKQRFGVGIYGLRKSVYTFDNKVDFLDATDTNRYRYGFFSLFYERILFQSKRWEITAPLHFNFGSLRASYLNTERVYIPFLNKPITSLTFSVKSHFKIYRWVGLHAGVGYSALLNGDKRTVKALNAPYYSFGVKLFVGELWKITFDKKYRKSEWTY